MDSLCPQVRPRGARHSVCRVDHVPWPSPSGTRRLRKLCLDQVTLDRGFEQQITTELPVLEDLSFKNTDLSRISRIMSDKLKNLTIDCCQKTGGSLSLSIAAPGLVSLHFSILFYNHARFVVAEAPSLVEASIRLVKNPRQKPCHWKLGCKPEIYMLRDLSKLLGSLFSSNVSSLKLAGFPKLVRPLSFFFLCDQIKTPHTSVQDSFTYIVQVNPN
jgi:hypothetical protein